MIWQRVFGDHRVEGSDSDLFALVADADPATLPALHVSCGKQDVLIGSNRAFLDACTARGIAVTSDFGPGEHEWGYWDARIQDVLAWLPLSAR
jgi:S-formylglutathione hydrolase FrmB